MQGGLKCGQRGGGRRGKDAGGIAGCSWSWGKRDPPAQGNREEDLGVMTGAQREMQGEFKSAGQRHWVLMEEDRDRG